MIDNCSKSVRPERNETWQKAKRGFIGGSLNKSFAEDLYSKRKSYNTVNKHKNHQPRLKLSGVWPYFKKGNSQNDIILL